MKRDILHVGLDPILHFEAVARFKSLKKAASELHLSSPAITQSIRKLEENLGVQLCIRSRGGFALTEAGKRLFLLSGKLKEELKGYERFLTEEEEFDGVLSVGMLDNFQNKKFEKAIEKTIHNFPKMKLSVQVHAATEIQQLVCAGEIDVGLGIFNRKLDQLSYKTIGVETIGHYISEYHPLWAKREVESEELRGYRKTWVDIINRDRNTLSSEIFEAVKNKKLEINSYVNNLNAGILMLRSGTSIVPLPAEYLESRNLDFKYRSLKSAFPPYALKQEATTHRSFAKSSPATKFLLEQLSK